MSTPTQAAPRFGRDRRLALLSLASAALLGAYNPPVMTVAAGDARAFQGTTGTGSVRVPVRLSRRPHQPVAVDFATADGTALAGADYVATSGTLSFPAGARVLNVPVQVKGDLDAREHFHLFISNPTAGLLLGNSPAKVSLRQPSTLSFFGPVFHQRLQWTTTAPDCPSCNTMPDMGAWQVAIADVNRDGTPDVFSYTPAYDRTGYLSLGYGDGTFQEPRAISGSRITHAVFADLDGDGSQDLVLLQDVNGAFPPSVQVLANNGAGSFSTYGSATFGSSDWPTRLAVADLNGDGLKDVVLTLRNASAGVRVLLNSGTGMQPPVAYTAGTSPMAVAVGNFAGDAKPDLVVANESSNDFSLLVNNGDGTFSAPVSYAGVRSPRDLVAADFNGDGKADVAVLSAQDRDLTVYAKGVSDFGAGKKYPTGVSGVNLQVVDLDGDGALDVLVGGSGDGAAVLQGNRDGTFAAPAYVGGGRQWVAAADVDLDGDADLVSPPPGYGQPGIAVYFNGGREQLDFSGPETTFAKRGSTTGWGGYLLAADFTGDGRVDLMAIEPSFSTFGDGTLLTNAGARTFTSASRSLGLTWTSASGMRAEPADVDADGDVDVVVPNGNHLSVLGNAGTGTFSNLAVPYNGPVTGFALTDLDADGDLDLVQCEGGATLTMARNDGATFTKLAAYYVGAGYGTATGAESDVRAKTAAVGELDGGGSPELVLAGDNLLYLLPGTTAGNWGGSTRLAFTGVPVELRLVDLDLDGDLDIVLRTQTALELYFNASGTFSSHVSLALPSSMYGMVVADLDGDGALDLLVHPSTRNQPARLYYNDGAGGFGTASTMFLMQHEYATAVASGDFDGDGAVDLASLTELLQSGTEARVGYSLHWGQRQLAGVLAVDFAPATTPPEGSATVTVTLDAPAPAGGTTVYLRIEGSTTLLTGPTSVVVPAGQRSASFTATVLPAAAGKAVLVTATLGGTAASNALVVEPVRPAAVSFSPNPVVASGTTTGTVTLNATAGSALLVSLSSSNPSVLPVPNNVTVAAGAKTATFVATTQPVATTTTITVTASASAGSATGTLTVSPVDGGQFATNGTVSTTHAGYAKDMVAGDFDRDGDVDALLGGNSGTKLGLVRNGGTGNFGAVSQLIGADGPALLASGDFDLDGIADVAVARTSVKTAVVFHLDGSGGATATGTLTLGVTPTSLVSADFDGDGRPDLASGGSSSGVTVLLNKATGWTSFTLAASGDWLAAGDLNGDGLGDLVAGSFGTFVAYKSVGDGTFTVAGTTNLPSNQYLRGMELADLDGDGDLDLVASAYASSTAYDRYVTPYFNNGLAGFTKGPVSHKVFTDAQYSAYAGLAVADLDGDGDRDIVVAGGPTSGSGWLAWVLNDGSGRFSWPQTQTLTVGPVAVEVADFDGDGDKDILVAHDTGTLTLVTNARFVPAAITTQPTSQSVFAGQTATFSVSATGTNVAYQWRKNGTAISGATGATFSIPSAALADAGSYDVVVSGDSGAPVTSSSATLTVNGPPAITGQPSAQTLFAGWTVSLSVSASGAGLAYQWRKDGVNLSGANAASYSKASASPADAGSYDVVVTNGAGSVTSNSAAVTVNGPPTITAQPSGTTVFAGQPFSLSVGASGVGLAYQWRKGGTALSGATGATFAVSSAAVSDSGSYDVVVSNGAGSVTSSAAAITVNGPPVITTQPANQAVYAGQPLTLTVAASGAGLSYQWRKAGAAVTGATSASYTVSSATAGDAGSYDVRVTNGAGSVTSNAASVTVNGAPVIVSQPANQTLFQGATLTLSVTATGAGLTYQWRKDGTNLAGATAATYGKAAASASDAGNYDVVVTNPAGSVTSASATVVVNGPPSISAQPVGQTLFAGQAFTLSVQANGVGLSYQWRKGGSPIAGASSASYSVSSAAVSASDTYDVVVSNGAGSVTSNAVTVIVNGPPAISSQPAGQTLYAGQSFTLSVTASGVGLSYQWAKGGVDLAGAIAAGYSVSAATAADAGSYTVRVTNGAGSVTSSAAIVSINGAPVVATQPAGATIFEGDALTLSVGATGAGLSYQWRKDGITLAGATSSTLSVARATAADAGVYDVVVTNAAGSVTSSGATVTVEGPPSITAQPVAQTVFAAQPFALSVSATGAGLAYQWRQDGVAIAGATSASFSVASAGAADAGSYDVLVSNPAGTATSAAVAVTVNGAPVLTTQPTAQTVWAGQGVTLSVTASGVALTYQWRKDGAAVSGATSATLSIASAATADAGTWDVQVSNPAGTVTSSAVAVVVHGPPVVTSQPAGQTLWAGQKLALAIAVDGAGLSYQWRKDGVPMDGVLSDQYTVLTAAPSDSGSYDVVVTNAAGTVTSSAAVVVVNGAPAIAAEPADQSVFVGQPLTLSVTATGASLAFQWRKGGLAIPGATAAIFTVPSASTLDSGTYDVVVTNGAGAVTSTVATVAVNGLPVILAQPTNKTVWAGQPFQLAVTASGAGLAYQWRHYGYDVPGATSATYAVGASKLEDAGSYDVQVSNGAGQVMSFTVAVAVNGPPVVLVPPVEQAVFAGEPFSLSATATGAGLTYQWRKDGAAIPNATSTTYAVASASDADAGGYDLQVTNGAGTTTSAAAKVTVHGAPVIVTQPVDRTRFAGEPVMFSVVATGKSLNWQWRRNGVALAGATDAALTIAATQAADAGSYDVQVSNPAGVVTSAAATLTLQGAPVISTQPADQTLFAGQKLGLSVTATGDGLTYQWRKGGIDLPGADQPTLERTPCTVLDAGAYDVRVSNGAGVVFSRKVTVVVNGTPLIVTQPEGHKLRVGETLALTVVASGAGLGYQWRKDGVELAGANGATFTKAAEQGDTGSYDVLVTNLAGSARSDQVMVVVSAPDAQTPPDAGEPAPGEDAGTNDGGAHDVETGCGCSSASAGGFNLLLLLGLAALARRRREARG